MNNAHLPNITVHLYNGCVDRILSDIVHILSKLVNSSGQFQVAIIGGWRYQIWKHHEVLP